MEEAKRRKIIYGFLAGVTLLFIVSMFLLVRNLSVEDLVAMTPANQGLAALSFLGLYGLKSLTIFFPIPILQAASGYVFPLGQALLINALGLVVGLSIPYGIGYKLGKKNVEALVHQFKKVKMVTEWYSENVTYFSFLTRLLGLPMDLVSLIMGSLKQGFGKYLLGSVLGMLPMMVATTCLGETIHSPNSPAFWASLGFVVIVAGISFLLYRRHGKQKTNA